MKRLLRAAVVAIILPPIVLLGVAIQVLEERETKRRQP